MEEVCAWLTAIGLGEHCGQFTENEIVGDHLADMSKEDLRELGVKKLGHQKTFYCQDSSSDDRVKNNSLFEITPLLFFYSTIFVKVYNNFNIPSSLGEKTELYVEYHMVRNSITSYIISTPIKISGSIYIEVPILSLWPAAGRSVS